MLCINWKYLLFEFELLFTQTFPLFYVIDFLSSVGVEWYQLQCVEGENAPLKVVYIMKTENSLTLAIFFLYGFTGAACVR